jgi:hypothetical protein
MGIIINVTVSLISDVERTNDCRRQVNAAARYDDRCISIMRKDTSISSKVSDMQMSESSTRIRHHHARCRRQRDDTASETTALGIRHPTNNREGQHHFR